MFILNFEVIILIIYIEISMGVIMLFQMTFFLLDLFELNL